MKVLQATATEQVIQLARLMLDDQKNAPPVYQPTKFWIPAAQKIMQDLETHGMENFKSMPSAGIYFVGAYRHASISEKIEDAVARLKELDIKIIDSTLINFLNGSSDFLSDYRVASACSFIEKPLVHVDQISESEYGNPPERHYLNGNLYTHTNLKYEMGLLALSNVCQNKNADLSAVRTFLEIGGGYGSLGEILLNADPQFRYFNVDIPPLAAISTGYLQEIFGKDAVLTYEQSRKMGEIDLNKIKKKYRAAVFCPWQLPSITGKIDVFVNFISFQEMEPNVVENYLKSIVERKPDYILLRNSRDGKKATTARVTNDFAVQELEKHNYHVQYRDALQFGIRNDQFASEVLVLDQTDGADPAVRLRRQASDQNRKTRFQLKALLSKIRLRFCHN
jgi:putative sugar O-methyltransferase